MKLSRRTLLSLLDGFLPSSGELFELIATYVRTNGIDVSEAYWLTPAKRRRLGVPAAPKNERRAVRRQAAKLRRSHVES